MTGTTRRRARFLGAIVADADRLLEQVRVTRGALLAGGPADTALAAAAGLLSRVLAQDIERKAAGPAIRQGTARDRVVSIHDPEMRHGRKSASKRFDGHKGAVAVDTDEQLITAVDVLAGNAPDAQDALALVEQTEQATGCAVDETDGDCAYGSGATRQAFAAAGRTLHAPVPASPNGGRLPKTAFTLDLAAPTCTCPAGQTTTTFSPNAKGEGGGRFTFPAATCLACPLREQCVKGVGGRTIDVHPQEPLLQAARAFQASDAWDEVRRRRQTVEHRFARLMQLGLRQARYVGRAKTLFQLALVAAVANLTRLAGLERAGLSAAGGLQTVVPAARAACSGLVFAASTPCVAAARRRAAGRAWPPTRAWTRPCPAPAPRMTAFRPDF